MATHRRMTADELLAHPVPHARTELVLGRLIVREPAGYEHGALAARALIEIGTFVRDHRLGHTLAAETGFSLFRSPDTVRAPDVAFVAAARVPAVDSRRGFPALAPDLVVEVVSPGERPHEIRETVRDWLGAGTRLVWVIDPVRRVARVHRADRSMSLLTDQDALEGEDVLPGFRVALRSLLD